MTDERNDNQEEYDGNPYDDWTAEQMADEFCNPKDALRVVRWSLERSCPYREGDGWELPDKTHEQLAELVKLNKRLGMDFEGICVTSNTEIYFSAEDFFFIPDRGYRVEDAFEPYGGVEAALDQCGTCPVNVDFEEEPNKRLAGCHGEFKIVSDHPLFSPVVQEAIKNRGLENKVAERFPKTNPPWYGFWMRSPLLRPQAQVLLPLLDEVFAHYAYGVHEGEERFLEALNLVSATGIFPMHVTLLPPESSDKFGFLGYHCPACKAPSPDGELPPQKTGLIRELPAIDCPVCGFRYSPQETRGLYQSPSPKVKDELLEDQMGSEAYWQFVHRYLLHRGVPPEQVVQHARWERKRRQENPDSWEEGKTRYSLGPNGEPYHGPPCSHCGKFLPSPEAKRCEFCKAEQQQ